MIYYCPRDGAELQGTFLDEALWCPEEGEEIPDEELEGKFDND